MLERVIENYFVAETKKRGAYALKVVVLAWRGWPDRLVLAAGARIFFVEFKRPGEKPRANQLAIHRLLRRLGFRVYVVASVTRAKAVLTTELGHQR